MVECQTSLLVSSGYTQCGHHYEFLGLELKFSNSGNDDNFGLKLQFFGIVFSPQ